MHPIEALLRDRIVSGLQRKAVTRCSKWAEAYRMMGQPFPGAWSFKHHPWLREMHDSTATLNVGQKSAQMGYTETVLNLAFYTLDIKGRDVLYVLPAKTPDASDFSAARFDPALELSSHLAKMFSDVKNVGHKRAGTRNMYIRGSRSRGGLKSVPVYLIILDEVNEMDQDNIPLALERTSGQTDYMHWMLSTPTIDSEGINKYFKESSQNHFHFRCPHCSRFIEFNFPDDLIVTADDVNDPALLRSHYRCNQCAHPLAHDGKIEYLQTGIWEPTFRGRESQGWYINQFYSMADAARPEKIAKLVITARSNKSDEQELFNSKGGLTHAVEGSRVTDHQIDSTIGTYRQLDHRPQTGFVTMGVDQGREINFEIAQWVPAPFPAANNDLSLLYHCRVIKVGALRDFEELDLLMKDFGINFCVIDSQPERRKATEFANRFYGHVRLCFYPEGINAKQINISDAGGEPQVSVDRTTWLDTSLGRFRAIPPSITLPIDIPIAYKQQIKAPIRVYSRDKHGNPIGRYVHADNDPDHFAHCRNYNEVALHLSAAIGRSQNMKSVL
jgi:hypothetical protein